MRVKSYSHALTVFGQFKTYLFKGVVLHPWEKGGRWNGVENPTECTPTTRAPLFSTIYTAKIIATPEPGKSVSTPNVNPPPRGRV